MIGRGGPATVIRRAALAGLGGFGLFAVHPPLQFGWLGPVALVPLLLLARDIATGTGGVRAALAWGTTVGVVGFAPLLAWIMRFGVAPWLLLSVMQSLFIGLFFVVVVGWGIRPGRAVVAVSAWVAAEWLRSQWPLGGFPWGVLGYSQHDGGWFLLSARTLGVLGVSALLAATAVAVEHAVTQVAVRNRREVCRGAAGLAAILVVAVLLGLPTVPATGGSVDVAGIQGNDRELPAVIDRGDLLRVEDIATRMAETTQLLRDAPQGPPDVVVWPENALDADPRDVPELEAAIDAALDAIGDGTLLAGTLLDGPRPRTFRNTISRFNDQGEIVDIYDKRIMVPFGEYVPWRRWIGGLPPLRVLPNDGIPGTQPKVFQIDDAVIGPVTCFESIFGGLVRDQVREGANVLVVTTNNASFGRSPASRQHLAFSQVRAVETGRWTLHAGISGISAVVDPAGGLSQQTALFERAIVRSELPLVEAWTPYVRIGDVVGPVAAALSALAMGLAAWRRRPAATQS